MTETEVNGSYCLPSREFVAEDQTGEKKMTKQATQGDIQLFNPRPPLRLRIQPHSLLTDD